MNKARTVIALLLLALLGTGGYLWLQARQPDKTIITLYGNVDIREVELAFRQSGRLLRMRVEEGASVRAGDLLAELDPQPYQEALAAAEAQVRQAQAEFTKLKRGNRPQEIRQAEEKVRQMEAVLHNAQADFERQETLAASGAISRKSLDAARSARDEAAASLASAQQSLSLQREGFRQEDIAMAEAKLATAEANLAQARTALADTRLYAPDDGILLSRVREPGSMLSNRDVVYSLALQAPLYIRAYASEADLGHLAPGTPVRIRSDSSAYIHHGKIGFVSPRAEFTPKSVETSDLRTDLVYRLRIVVQEDKPQELRQGMPVTLEIDRKTSVAPTPE